MAGDVLTLNCAADSNDRLIVEPSGFKGGRCLFRVASDDTEIKGVILDTAVMPLLIEHLLEECPGYDPPASAALKANIGKLEAEVARLKARIDELEQPERPAPRIMDTEIW